MSKGLEEGWLPHLATFSDEAIAFPNCYANAPWTLPSHASMLTGQYPSEHGIHAASPTLEPEVIPLPARLKDLDYETVAFTNNSWISREFDFDKGFDEFYERWRLFETAINPREMAEEEGLINKFVALLDEVTVRNVLPSIANGLYAKYLQEWYDNGAFLTNLRLKRWLGRRSESDFPFFAFVNYLEPHLEYRPPHSFATKTLPEDVSVAEANEIDQDAWGFITGEVEMSGQDFELLEMLYDAELSYLDHRIGKLLEFLRTEGIYDETVIVITADHGENIGDHGLMDHQYSLHDTLLNVPLFIRHPDAKQGFVDDSLVELRDLYPTLSRIADGTVPDEEMVSTKSFVQFDSEKESAGRQRALAQYIVPQPSVETLLDKYEVSRDVRKFDRELRSIRTPEWKCIQPSDGEVELYDVRNDPEESRNVASDEPTVVDALCDQLEAVFGRFGVNYDMNGDEVSRSAAKRLEDLGYI